MPETDSVRDMLGREGLTPVHSAKTILLSHLENLEHATETIVLADALNRISSSRIDAPEDLPPCDRSTMDGYAVIAADTFGAGQSLPAYLNVTGEVLMGKTPEGTVTRGSCYKIPTGGILPFGSDSVMMLEHTVPVDAGMIEIVKDVGSGSNVIRKGDDISKNEQAIAAGTLIRPQDIGLLAGLGILKIEVFRQVKVGIISTGDEIIEPGQPLSPGKIRNINSITLGGCARRLGAEVIDYGIVPDSEESFFATVERAVVETDLVMFSGGSSVGMRDLGEQAIVRLGAPGVLVHGVALKPGKPVIIGFCRQTPIFGLPGHPVSAAVCFDLFVKPSILTLSGLKNIGAVPEPYVNARLKRSINSAAGRLDLIRVTLTYENSQYLAFPVLGRSGAISSLSRAHGYFLIDEDSQGMPDGSLIEVYLYQ